MFSRTILCLLCMLSCSLFAMESVNEAEISANPDKEKAIVEQAQLKTIHSTNQNGQAMFALSLAKNLNMNETPATDDRDHLTAEESKDLKAVFDWVQKSKGKLIFFDTEEYLPTEQSQGNQLLLSPVEQSKPNLLKFLPLL